MRRKIFLHFVRNLPQTIIEQVKRICYNKTLFSAQSVNGEFGVVDLMLMKILFQGNAVGADFGRISIDSFLCGIHSQADTVSAVPEIDSLAAAYTFDGCDLRMIVSADRDRYIG